MRPALALIAVLALADRARAAPIATASEDVDGDGAADALELRADGSLVITARPAATLPIASGITRARIEVTRYRGRTLIAVEATTGADHLAVILALDGRKWRELTRFPLGGVGLDHEYGIEIDTTPSGIYRYQARGGIKRCDGKPAYLFPEGFDPVAKKFRKVLPPAMLEPTAPRLAARVDPAPAVPPLLFRAQAASHQPGAADAGALSIPRELDDGRNDTYWAEDLGSDGRGQFFSFEPRASGMKARQLRIVSGRQTSVAALKRSNRVRELGIVTAQGSWRVELPDAASEALGTAFVVELPDEIAGCVSVVIAETYGPRTGTTAISELALYADGEREGGGDALLVRVVADGKDGAVNAAAALGKRGAAGAIAIDAELAKTTDVDARRRLIGALAKIRDPAAAPALVRAAMAGWVHGEDLLDVIDALAANGQVQALHDLADRSSSRVELRIAAAARLTPTGDGLDALLELAGKGPHALRREVIERLALAPASALAQAASTQRDAKVAGDLWRALTRRARGHASERPAAVAAMAAVLPTAVDYERRYRLIDGIASHGDAAALRALETLLRSLPAGPRSAALRQVAVRGIATAPRPEASAIVLQLTHDTDPGVRLAALSVLASAETDVSNPWHTADGPDGIDRVIINRLTTDTWPEIRRRAATALGSRCQRTGPATALRDRLAKDPELEVRIDALSALVQCKAAGIAELLERTWNSSKAPVEVRQTAVRLVVDLGDRRLATALVAKLGRWRGEAIESKPALELAQDAAATLGRMNPPGAAKALIAALHDSAFPEIVTAAALALGALGPACPPAAKAKLNILARSTGQSAVAARRAAAQCGT